MSYDGWREVIVVWNSGVQEIVQALGRPDPYVFDGILHLRVSDDEQYRHIPLTAIREWRMKEYR